MNNSTKQQIVEQLRKDVSKSSLNKHSVKIGVSSGTVSNMLSGKWDKISDDMFRLVQSSFVVTDETHEVHAETRTYKAAKQVFDNAKFYANVSAAVARAGSGKTYSMERFRALNKEVFYVKCMRSTTERDFLADLSRSLGIGKPATRVTELMRHITVEIKKRQNPLIIIDEIEKTKGHDIFMLFIDLYNQLYKIAGIVLIGTPNLKTRIEHYNSNNRLGYDEVFSRIGGNVIELPSANISDAKAICSVNHITDPETVSEVVNDSITDHGNYDLRRVDRKIHSKKLQEAA